MSKKSKKKDKKPNPKKEKYLKFRKEKPTAMNYSSPELTDEDMKEAKVDEMKIEKFLRFNRNPPEKEIVERKMRSKR